MVRPGAFRGGLGATRLHDVGVVEVRGGHQLDGVVQVVLVEGGGRAGGAAAEARGGAGRRHLGLKHHLDLRGACSRRRGFGGGTAG